MEVLERGDSKQGVQWLEVMDSEREDKEALRSAYAELQKGSVVGRQVEGIVKSVN